MVDDPILVLAATGGQGRAVTDALLTRGARVRALVRDPARPAAQELAEQGVEVVAGSLNDRESLTTAMRGATAVFAFTTPFEAGVEAEVEQGRAILAAATGARVPHLVLSSVAGADRHTGVPHFDSKARIEAELTSGDVPYTILGPTYFYDNALGGADRILAGTLDLPCPPTAHSNNSPARTWPPSRRRSCSTPPLTPATASNWPATLPPPPRWQPP